MTHRGAGCSKEQGWYVFGAVDYRFDPLTRAALSGRSYTWANRRSGAFRAEVEHDFSDVRELRGFVGSVYYSSQDAVFDLAATQSLQTWTALLRSNKIGFIGHYTLKKRTRFDGEISHMSISDGNSRTDLWVEGLYEVRKPLEVGIRYESVHALKQFAAYWSPSDYRTLSGVVQVRNNFVRWAYLVRGTYGQVLTTSDQVASFSGSLNYRAGDRSRRLGRRHLRRRLRPHAEAAYLRIQDRIRARRHEFH